jgi:DnaK suppressor protein
MGATEMNANDLNRYKDQLLGLQGRLRSELSHMAETIYSDAFPPGERNRRPSETIDKEIVLEGTEESIQCEVAAALTRIEEGTYGYCLDCGAEIPRTRLNAVPYTPYCVKCERRHEP